MLFGKNRVEEDLERIRSANLPPEKLKEEVQIKNQETQKVSDEKLHLEKNDLLAMVLAVFSLIIPYVLIFIAIMGFLAFLMYKFFL